MNCEFLITLKKSRKKMRERERKENCLKIHIKKE